MSYTYTAYPPMDVTNCADEPIHIPGSIQPHGYLLAVEEQGLIIRQLSANCQSLFKTSVAELLESPLERWLTGPSLQNLQEKLRQDNLRKVNPLKLELRGGERLDAVVLRSQGLLLLELEEAQAESHPAFLDIYQKINAAVEEIGWAKDLAELYRVTTERVKELTGYQRVMIYEFDTSWNGRVVAEVCEPHQEPFLGLHYPASDIPAQARLLYTSNWLRSIPDVAYVPSPLLASRISGREQPLDLSGCSLRSVSPMHIQYLKNMSVGASTSVSVIKDGVLWGLIALHHEEPAYLSYEVRQGLEFIGRIFSIQQAAKQKFENLDYKNHLKALQPQLLQQMKEESAFLEGLQRGRPNFLDLAQGCCGGAIVQRGKWQRVGEAPPEEFLQRLVAWLLNTHPQTPLFYTASLTQHFAEAAAYSDCASGLLAVSIPEVEPCYVFWFKPEVIQTVNWGGDPNKAIQSSDGAALSPRRSFALWQETVRLTALPWQPEEIEAVEELRRSIIEVDLESQVRAAMDSNAELEQFATVISHDLKEPLRGIGFFTDFLLEDLRGKLDSEALAYLKEIKDLSDKAKTLIADLYEYSKVGRVDMSFALTDLNEVVRSAAERLRAYFTEQNVELIIPQPLPKLFCDRIRVCELFANLLTNAVKYNEQLRKRIEVGVGEGEDAPVLYVKDNGIGIDAGNQERVFAMFQRLHGADEYGGGTGVGLAIVKRIIDRHGGRIWIESAPGRGSTFYFTLRPEAQHAQARSLDRQTI